MAPENQTQKLEVRLPRQTEFWTNLRLLEGKLVLSVAEGHIGQSCQYPALLMQMASGQRYGHWALTIVQWPLSLTLPLTVT